MDLRVPAGSRVFPWLNGFWGRLCRETSGRQADVGQPPSEDVFHELLLLGGREAEWSGAAWAGRRTGENQCMGVLRLGWMSVVADGAGERCLAAANGGTFLSFARVGLSVWEIAYGPWAA